MNITFKIFFSFVFLPLSIFAECKEHKSEKIHFSDHVYICFDDKYFIHDPDCCCFRLRGSIHQDGQTTWIDISTPPRDM